MNNKGFTLIELVVAMVVSSVVISLIGIYTIVGLRNFRDAKAETMAQEESEIIVMAIKDKLKSAKNYQVYSEDNIYAVEIIYGEGTDTDYKSYDCAFVYDSSNTDLYITNNGESDTFGIDFENLDMDELRKTGLISQYVTGFEVTPTNALSAINNIANTYIRTTVGRITYTQSFNIKLRNF